VPQQNSRNRVPLRGTVQIISSGKKLPPWPNDPSVYDLNLGNSPLMGFCLNTAIMAEVKVILLQA
jgi:hypothetical protein